MPGTGADEPPEPLYQGKPAKGATYLMKPIVATTLPIVVATLGIACAIGAVSKSSASLEPQAEIRIADEREPEIEKPKVRLESPRRSAREVEVAATPKTDAPKPWTSSQTVSRPSRITVPRNYQPTLRGQDISEEDLGRHVLNLAALDRSKLQGLRLRYLSLPSRIETVLLGRELPPEDYSYEQALESLCDEIEELLVQSHRDYFMGRRFPYSSASEGPLTPRLPGNSQFTTQGMHVVGNWYVDAGFHSSDYPDLEAKLNAARRMRIERVDFLDRSLNVH